MTDVLSYLTTHDSLANSLVAVFVILLLMGRIHPRSTLEEKNREAERWRKAYELEREARSKAVEQAADLMEMAKTTQAIVTALFQSTRPDEQTGGQDVVNPSKSSRRRR